MDSREGKPPAQASGTELPGPVPRRYVGSGKPAKQPNPQRSYRPDPAWNKLLILVGVAVVAAVLLVVPGILNRGGKNPIADAAEATRNAPGVRMSVQMSAQGPVPMTMTGTGVMNGETQRAWMEFKATLPGGGGEFSMTEVIDDLDLYMRMPQITERLGGGKSWLLIRAESFLGDLYQGGSGALGAQMSASPAQQLEQLESGADDVTMVGRERLGDVETTHYAATIEIQQILDDLSSRSSKLADLVESTLEGTDGSEQVDVWIDDAGLVRRMRMQMTLGAMGSFTMTMDFFDYGIHPRIDVPPESDVFDATQMIDQLLSGSGAGAF